jgi:EAL domain-containing protein (putative c-di-GMP-specific phosphodiesterase class I)
MGLFSIWSSTNVRNYFLTNGGGPVDEQIQQMLRTIRQHLDMDVGFIAEFRDGRRFFRHVDASQPAASVKVGGSDPLEASYCHFVVSGAFPELMQDAAQVPVAAAMPVTRALPVGAHLSVPIRLPDGDIYGTFCCFSHKSDRSLNKRDLALLKVFADVAGGLLHVQAKAEKERKEKTSRIERLIEMRDLSIAYQPIYRLSDDSLASFEALSRFSAPPARSPDQWFAEAAEVELGVELELLAAQEACLALLALSADIALAVNLSPQSILDPRFSALFKNLPVDRLVLEVTEHAVIESYPEMDRVLASLRQRGLRLAVDDAGAGHSSFRHVLDLKPDLVKLDMSLTRDIHSDPARRALAEALTSFGRAMGCQIVAEGVETDLELEALRDIGVTKVQGYLVGRPMSLKEATTLPPFLAGRKRLGSVRRAKTDVKSI